MKKDSIEKFITQVSDLSQVKDRMDRDRFLSYGISILCFGIIFVIGFWVTFHSETKAINIDPYTKESEKYLPLNDNFGWDTATSVIEGTSVTLKNIYTCYYKDDLLKWNLKADMMANGDTPGSMKCIMVRLVDNQHGSGDTQLWAEEAVLDTRGRQVVMSGDVNVVSQSGYKFFTEELIWSEKSGLIKTDLPWTLIYPNRGVLKGEGFSSDLQFKNQKYKNIQSAKKN